MGAGAVQRADGEAGIAPAEIVRRDARSAELLARYRLAATLVQGRRVLDYRCGVGHQTAVLLEAGASEVVGIDPRPALVDAAKARQRPGLRFERVDLDALDGDFDVVVWLDADADGLDSELPALARVLAPEGLAVVAATARPAELEGVLERVLPQVRVLEQRTWVATSVAAPGEATLAAPALPSDEPSGAGSLDAGACVALAGRVDLPEPAGALTLVPTAAADAWLAHSERQRGAIADRETRIAELEGALSERSELRRRLVEAEQGLARTVALEAERDRLRVEREHLLASKRALDDVLASPSWRVTRPLRLLKRWARGRG